MHGPQMAKKMSLWISTLFHPITMSPAIEKLDNQWGEKMPDSPAPHSIPWAVLGEGVNASVNTAPDIERKSQRKESLGGGVTIREQLIRDLE